MYTHIWSNNDLMYLDFLIECLSTYYHTMYTHIWSNNDLMYLHFLIECLSTYYKAVYQHLMIQCT